MGAYEDQVASVVLDVLRDDPSFSMWLLRASLPEDHALRSAMPASPPVVLDARWDAGELRLELALEDPDAGWRLLIVAAVRVEAPSRKEHYDAVRARGEDVKAQGRVNGWATAVIAPRRYARDSATAQRFGRIITVENLADAVGVHGAGVTPDVPPARRSALYQCAAAHAKAASVAAKGGTFWAAYEGVCAGYAEHLRIIRRNDLHAYWAEFEPARTPRLESLPAFSLRHAIDRGRAALHVSRIACGSAEVFARVREEAPRDLYIDETPAGLSLWHRVPVINPARPEEVRVEDIRHGVLAILRLRQWQAQSLQHWARWQGLSTP